MAMYVPEGMVVTKCKPGHSLRLPAAEREQQICAREEQVPKLYHACSNDKSPFQSSSHLL